MQSIRRSLERISAPERVGGDAFAPALYDDLVVRRSEAVYQGAAFDGFLFDVATRPRPGSHPTQRYKFARLTRLVRVAPLTGGEGSGFAWQDSGPNVLDMQRDVLAALRQAGIHMVTMVGNDPDDLGTLLLYGVQAGGDTVDEARQRSAIAEQTLLDVMRGTFRQSQMRPLDPLEVDWLNTNLHLWSDLAVFRGIPHPRTGVTNVSQTDPTGVVARDILIEEQIEEFVRGLANHPYLLMLLASPVGEESIIRLLNRVSYDLGKVASDVERTQTLTAGVALPIGFAANMGESHGVGSTLNDAHNIGGTVGVADTLSVQDTVGLSETDTLTASETVSQSEQAGVSTQQTQSQGLTEGVTFGESLSEGQAVSHGQSVTDGHAVGTTQGISESMQQSVGRNATDTVGTNSAFSTNQSVTESAGQTDTVSAGTNAGESLTSGFTLTETESETSGQTEGTTQTGNVGVNLPVVSMGGSESTSSSSTYTAGTSEAEATSSQVGVNQGVSLQEALAQMSTVGTTSGSVRTDGATQSASVGLSENVAAGRTVSQGTSEQFSQQVGESVQEQQSRQQGVSLSQSVGRNTGISDGVGQNYSQSAGTSQGVQASNAVGVSQSESQGAANTVSEGSSRGYQSGQGVSNTLASTQNWIGNMAAAPQASVAMQKRIFDERKRALSQILTAQRNRLLLAREEGAFACHMYLLAPDERIKESAVALAKSSFWGTNEGGSIPVPFHALSDLEPDERDHIRAHARTFSACLVREPGPEALEDHAYSSILVPSELCVLTHPPRTDLPGVQVGLPALPSFRVPVDADRAVHLGHLIYGETGEVTPFRYGLDERSLTHMVVSGASGSGKSVSAMRLVHSWVGLPARPARVRQADGTVRTEMRKPPALILDWKSQWRAMAVTSDLSRFRFASLRDPEFGFRYNPLACPAEVPIEMHRDSIVEVMALALQLGVRGRSIIWRELDDLYDTQRPARWVDPTADAAQTLSSYDDPRMSRFVGLPDLYTRVERRLDIESSGTRAGHDVKDRLQVVLSRLIFWRWGSSLTRIYGRDVHTDELTAGTDQYNQTLAELHQRGWVDPTVRHYTIDDLIGGDDITVMEGGGLDSIAKKTVIGFIASSIFNVARIRGDKAFDPPLLMVLEEAAEVIGIDSPESKEVSGVTQSYWELMFNEIRSYGVRLMAIIQHPSQMPPSVLANSQTLIAHNMSNEDDIDYALVKFGKDPRIDERHIKKLIAQLPQGWCIVRAPQGSSYEAADIVLVHSSMLGTPTPSDQMLLARAIGHAT